jgi:predicted esterase
MGAGTNFAAVRRQVLELHSAGDYATALEVARVAAADFPDEAARTTYWIACLLSLLGAPERGLETLEDGARRGLWWAPQMLEADPDLEPMRADDRFRAIVESGRRAQASAAARPPVEPIVRLPASGQPRAALVMLHARGQRAQDVVEPFAAATDVLLVAPYSTQPFDTRDSCWDEPQRAEADVQRAVESTLAGEVDLPLVVAGFSQGAALAVFLAAVGRLRGLVGCLAVAPSAAWARELIGSETPSARGLRFALIIGDLDQRLDDCRRFAEELRAGGAEVRLDVVAGLGHDYPVDFRQRLPAIMDWLLSDELQ